ncbi:uncharacterized protein LOC128892336 isoform X2 [Hylaeus anthracinus]|uniref:uncharacterized protein LOC128892336 isoform X2 n=1 Tax=Hylaeus anthracinus TaxID=313031 RepID=UPI0023B90702|nr:uncharacterized protein LOC128892336 isoform X2 [Hylaeus anthracinus]
MPPTRASRGLAKGDLEVSSRTPSLLLKTSNREQFSKVTLNIEGNYLRILTRHREVCTEFCNQKFFLCIKTMSSLEEVTYGLDRLIFRDTHIIGQYGVSYIVTPLGMPQLPLPPRFFAAAVPQPPPPPPTFARRQRENVSNRRRRQRDNRRRRRAAVEKIVVRPPANQRGSRIIKNVYIK